MTQRVIFALNPTSDHGRARRYQQQILSALRATDVIVDDVTDISAEVTLRRAKQAMSDDVCALIVAGGDGMVHLGMQAVACTSVPLGVIGIGSGNDNARALGLPRHNVTRALQVITDYVRLGAGVRQIDAAQITRGDGSTELYGGVLSLGLDAHTNEIANTLSWPRGIWLYLRALARAVRVHQPYGFEVVVDGESISACASVIAIANGPLFGGGLPVAPNAVLDDGQLNFLISAPLRRREIPWLLIRLVRGKHLTHRKVRHWTAKTVEIAAGSQGATPPVAYADGESMGTLPLTVEIVPGALNVIVGGDT